MSQFLIIIVLLLLICAAALTLWLDARQKRIDRQLAIALPTSHSASLPSIRRLQAGSRWLFLHRLANYRAGIAYDWHPAYVLLAGVIAAAAIFYANTLLGFSTLYVSLAAAIVAIMVVRGLFGWQQGRFTNQLFRQLPDTIELVTSTVRSGLPVHEAFRIISREMPQPTAGQFAIVCSELNLGRPPDEVRWQFDRNLADTGRHCASTCGASCSREGSGSRGDLFLKSTFVRARHCRWVTILAQSAIS